MDESFLQKWAQAKAALQGTVSVHRYNAFFKDLQFINIDGDNILLEAPDAFTATNISQMYVSTLESAVQVTFGKRYNVAVYAPGTAPVPENKQDLDSLSCALDSRYTFDSFIIGPSNRFAHAACVAVAERPATAYNPLFIYGGVGLGKTHLMHATGHYMLQNNPGMKLLYITSETFTNELINAIRTNTSQKLRNRLRSVDLLLIDDIQFIAGKEATQEEFFHTFNHLRDNGKQVILSSDRPPKDITGLEDRLRSRFEGGLLVDVKKPDYETRLAILTHKVEAERLDVEQSVLEMIASSVSSNIRELEGSLNRLAAMAELTHERITMQMAENALSAISKPHDARSITPELIMGVVSDYTNIPVAEITGKKRSREIALARQYAIYLCREMTSLSTTRIGEEFGKRDHTTIMHAHEKVKELLTSDADVKRTVAALQQKINER